MTTQNWPDPKRPGVPMFPERDGWHVVTFWRSDRQVTGFWHAEKQKWGSIDGVYKFTPQDAVNNIKYDAASLTPTHINEMLAAERKRAAMAIDHLKNEERGLYATGLMTNRAEITIRALASAADAIRNLGDAP